MVSEIKESYLAELFNGNFKIVDIAKKDLEKTKEAEKLAIEKISEADKLKDILPGMYEGAKRDLENVRKKKKELEEFNDIAPYFKESIIQYKTISENIISRVERLIKEYKLNLDTYNVLKKVNEGTLEELLPKFPEQELTQRCPEVYNHQKKMGHEGKEIKYIYEIDEQKPITKDDILNGLAKNVVEKYFDNLLSIINPKRSENFWKILLEYSKENTSYIKKKIKQTKKNRAINEKIREEVASTKEEYIKYALEVEEYNRIINSYFSHEKLMKEFIAQIKNVYNEALKKLENNFIHNNMEELIKRYSKSRYLPELHFRKKSPDEIKKYGEGRNINFDDLPDDEIDAFFEKLNQKTTEK